MRYEVDKFEDLNDIGEAIVNSEFKEVLGSTTRFPLVRQFDDDSEQIDFEIEHKLGKGAWVSFTDGAILTTDELKKLREVLDKIISLEER